MANDKKYVFPVNIRFYVAVTDIKDVYNAAQCTWEYIDNRKRERLIPRHSKVEMFPEDVQEVEASKTEAGFTLNMEIQSNGFVSIHHE